MALSPSLEATWASVARLSWLSWLSWLFVALRGTLTTTSTKYYYSYSSFSVSSGTANIQVTCYQLLNSGATQLLRS